MRTAINDSDKGLHRILYRFSTDDYKKIAEVWHGPHPEDGKPLEVQDGPPKGYKPPDLPAEPQLTSPDGTDNGPDPDMLKEYADRIFGTSMAVSMATPKKKKK